MVSSFKRWPSCLLVLAVLGCGDAGPAPGDAPPGSVAVSLTLPDGIEINEVLYAVSGNGIVPMTGAIDTPDGR